MRRVTISVQTLYILLKDRAYRRALRRGEDHEWDPPHGKRSLPSRWRALASDILARLPLLEKLSVEVWGYQSFDWKREEGLEGQVGSVMEMMAEVDNVDSTGYEHPLC